MIARMPAAFRMSAAFRVSVALAIAPGLARAAPPADPFKNPDAEWITTGRGIACPSREQMAGVEAALVAGDMDRFHALAAGCVAPEAGVEVRIVDLSANGLSTLLLVAGADATGPWYAGRIFFARRRPPAP